MMKTEEYLRISSVLFFLVFIFAGCDKIDTETETLNLELEQTLVDASGGVGIHFFQMPEADNFAAIPQDPKNPLTAEKVALGELLFHETALATNAKKDIGMQTYSCASCHHVAAAFAAGLPQGMGEGGQGFGTNGEGRVYNNLYDHSEMDVQPIRSPSAMNVAWQNLMLWNGQFGATGANVGTEAQWTAGTPKAVNQLGYEGIETQAIAGLSVHRMDISTSMVATNKTYQDLFNLAFPNVPADERISTETAGLAMAAYERTLLSTEAPFQRWLRGDKSAMTPSQLRGAILFFGKANCVSCHTGPALNDMNFYALGMDDLSGSSFIDIRPAGDKTHLGRASFTQRTEDEYKFKTPQLYNLRDAKFYGHGASFSSIRDVVAYKNNAQPENGIVPTSQIDSRFQPLGLTQGEIDDITSFLTNALFDGKMKRYLPKRLPSGNCFIVNDAQSRKDLGCK